MAMRVSRLCKSRWCRWRETAMPSDWILPWVRGAQQTGKRLEADEPHDCFRMTVELACRSSNVGRGGKTQ